MELTPDLLLEAKFSAARRGYDMAEVDDFLERCAEGLDVLLSRLRAEFDRAERAEADLAAVQRNGAAATAPAPEVTDAEPDPSPFDDDAPAAAGAPAEPASTPAVAGVAEPGDETVSPAVGEPMRILIHAERTAEAAIAEAQAEAARIRSEAETVAGTQRTEAETLLARARTEAEAEARRAGDEVRRSIQGEVITLRRDRDALNDDIRMLRRWLDDQRGRLRTTARDLQRLVDDPAALRDIAAPETSTVDDDTDAGPVGAASADADADSSTWNGPADGDGDDGEPTQAVPAFDGPGRSGDDADGPADPEARSAD